MRHQAVADLPSTVRKGDFTKLKPRRILALFVLLNIAASFSVFANDIYITRGEVRDMLLSAADFYNPSVVSSDIIKDYGDGNLHEEKSVTRAEALVMLSRAFKEFPLPVGHNKRVALTAKDFYDIPEWAEKELSAVFESGIAAGMANGIFSPDELVTREQMELFIKRVYSLYAANPKDDFYASVNKETLENIEILSGNVSAGTLETMQINVAGQIDAIINEICSRNYPEGTPSQKMADFYKCIVDTDSRNKEGINPIKSYIERIDSVKNITELTRMHDVLAGELYVNPFLKFTLTVDLDNSSKYMLYFESIRPLMNKELYFESGEKQQAYISYLKTLLMLGGNDESSAIYAANSFFEFEKELARSMLSAEQEKDISKVYNVNSYNKLNVIFPDFDLETVLSNSYLQKDERVVVRDMNLTEKFSELYNQSNLDVLKTAMKISLLVSCGETLSENFVKAQQKLDSVILGTDGDHSKEQYALSIIQSVMPEYLGQLYTDKYFDKRSKEDVESMTHDIIDVFKKRIEKLEWMSHETKEKAKIKLDNVSVKIGCPDISETYLDNVSVVPLTSGGTYFKNMLSITKEQLKFYGAMQFSDVKHDMWIMEPYAVNAAYNASSNDITLPAAVLQQPLYDPNASYEKNLGGIGYIIAHEITHAFDSNGAKFDKKGNMNNWWTDEDYAAFSLLCKDVISFFDGEEAIMGVQNNGTLTLDENIADLGAAACITQLAKEKGNVDFNTLYTAVANTWVNTSSREYAAYAAMSDVHSNGKLRVNRVLVNIDEFYEAFDIKEGDGMYVAPEERITVW